MTKYVIAVMEVMVGIHLLYLCNIESYFIIIKESEPVKCKNKCDEQMALLQKNFYENKKALAEKEKYIIHGLFNNDKVYFICEICF